MFCNQASAAICSDSDKTYFRIVEQTLFCLVYVYILRTKPMLNLPFPCLWLTIDDRSISSSHNAVKTTYSNFRVELCMAGVDCRLHNVWLLSHLIIFIYNNPHKSWLFIIYLFLLSIIDYCIGLNVLCLDNGKHRIQ